MGSSDRLNYTVLGARVNLAARLCSAAGPMEAYIDDATRGACGEDWRAEPLSRLGLKGFSREVPAWRLVEAADSGMGTRRETAEGRAPQR